MRETKVQQHLWGQACGAALCLLLLLFRFRRDSFGGDQTVEPKGRFSLLDFGQRARNPNTSPVRVNSCFNPLWMKISMYLPGRDALSV